jgi:hypothetical protein
MAASRWNVDFSDMFYGMENEDADYEEIIFQSDDLDSSSGSSAPLSSADPQSITTTLPDVLPIIALTRIGRLSANGRPIDDRTTAQHTFD